MDPLGYLYLPNSTLEPVLAFQTCYGLFHAVALAYLEMAEQDAHHTRLGVLVCCGP